MEKEKFRFPKLGMRTVKTAICVLICLIISKLIGQEGEIYSSVAAIVCMQSTIENTMTIGINRLVGTAIGGGFGMLLLLITENSTYSNLHLIVIPLGIILVIYFCNLINMVGSSTIGAIVFIAIFISPLIVTSMRSPYILALSRILDTVIGIVVAMVINRYIAPARRYEPKAVHLSCDTYPHIYKRIKPKLSGKEALILYDSRLTCELGEVIPMLLQKGDPTVRVPVPIEHSTEEEILIAYVDREYELTLMKCRQEGGYIEIPPETVPCTVVWQQ